MSERKMKPIRSYYDPKSPVMIDVNKLTVITWSGWTGDFFFEPTESNGVIACLNGDIADERLYKAIERMVKHWTQIDQDEISAVEYRRP